MLIFSEIYTGTTRLEAGCKTETVMMYTGKLGKEFLTNVTSMTAKKGNLGNTLLQGIAGRLDTQILYFIK